MRPDEVNELFGVLERIALTIVVGQLAGRVSPQGQNVFDTRGRIRSRIAPISSSDGKRRSGAKPPSAWSRAEFARSGREFALGSSRPHHMSPKRMRAKSLQLGDRLKELSRSPVGLGREELEAESGRTCLENI